MLKTELLVKNKVISDDLECFTFQATTWNQHSSTTQGTWVIIRKLWSRILPGVPNEKLARKTSVLCRYLYLSLEYWNQILPLNPPFLFRSISGSIQINLRICEIPLCVLIWVLTNERSSFPPPNLSCSSIFFHSHSLSGLCLRLYKRFFEEDYFCKLLNDKLCLYDYNLYHTRVFRPGFIQLFIILIVLIIFFFRS